MNHSPRSLVSRREANVSECYVTGSVSDGHLSITHRRRWCPAGRGTCPSVTRRARCRADASTSAAVAPAAVHGVRPSAARGTPPGSPSGTTCSPGSTWTASSSRRRGRVTAATASSGWWRRAGRATPSTSGTSTSSRQTCRSVKIWR